MLSIIKPKFRFFQMQIKSRLLHTFKFSKSGFGISPKPFNAIYVRSASDKFIRTMINTKVFFITNVNQAIVTSPTVRMNNTVQTYLSAYDLLQSGFRAIRNYFCIHFPISFKDSKYNSLSIGSSTSFAFDTLCSKEGFINFYFSRKRRFLFTVFSDSFSDCFKISINRITVQSGNLCYLSSC